MILKGDYMSKENKFYVYEWYNIDTNEVFYVGKGKGKRYRRIDGRNIYFKNYHNNYNCGVRKVLENLNEDEAFSYEIKLITSYRDDKQCKCNISDGGQGACGVKRTDAQKNRSSLISLIRCIELEIPPFYSHSVSEAFDQTLSDMNIKKEDILYLCDEDIALFIGNYRDTKNFINDSINMYSCLVYDEYGNREDGWECLDD
jgi:hypothetical protein